MSTIDQTRTENRTITAFFDLREGAEKASRDLVDAGIARDRITIVAGAAPGVATTAHPPVEDKTFWESLKDMFLPEEDRQVYAEGLRRGGYLLTVRAEHSTYERVLDILDREGTVDMSERESAWRSEGWQGYKADADGRKDQAPQMAASTAAASTAAARNGPIQRDKTTVESLATGRDEVLPVMEEKIEVGKRDVSHGKVRLRSYVVATPVNEQVNLRSESIEVNRRPVDRPVGAADATFQDRMIEAEEYAEEAVVSKKARVIEEVSLRKVADSRTETVSDTVRRTEVEVDDARGHGLAAAKSSSLIIPHMDVIASDGQKVGTVDHLEGQDKIKLAKATSSDGQHHFIPLAWVDHVDRHVHLNKPKVQVQSGW